MTRTMLILALGAIAAGCATTPPPDPITMDEYVTLARRGADDPLLEEALDTRPLGFALTYENMKKLERRGVPAEAIDRLVSATTERRARQIAPRYTYSYYDPFWDPWYGPRVGFGFGYHRHYHR